MSLKLPEKTVTPRERGAIPSPSHANYILVALWIMCLSKDVSPLECGPISTFLPFGATETHRRNTLDYPLTSNFGVKSELVPERPTAYRSN